jgi:hypothetical protein
MTVQTHRAPRLSAMEAALPCDSVSSFSRVRSLSPKLFGNCAKTSSHVSVAFRQAINKRCRIGVDSAPVDTWATAEVVERFVALSDRRRWALGETLGQRFHGSNHIRQPRRAYRTRCG